MSVTVRYYVPSVFDIAPGTTRVALSRMVARGELGAEDGRYALAGRLLHRQETQDWSLDPALLEWDGTWRMFVVEPESRPADERLALREAMRRLRFAQWREGVWVRPDNLPTAAHSAADTEVAAAQCTEVNALPNGVTAELAHRLFALDARAERCRVVFARLAEVLESLAAGDADTLRSAFVVGAATLVEVRADPLLPDALLPAGWPLPELRDRYRDYLTLFTRVSAAWLRSEFTNGGARRTGRPSRGTGAR